MAQPPQVSPDPSKTCQTTRVRQCLCKRKEVLTWTVMRKWAKLLLRRVCSFTEHIYKSDIRSVSRASHQVVCTFDMAHWEICTSNLQGPSRFSKREISEFEIQQTGKGPLSSPSSASYAVACCPPGNPYLYIPSSYVQLSIQA